MNPPARAYAKIVHTAFKIRGATNAILSLSSNSASTDVTLPPNLTVITHSSGNHAQALSYAARALSIACEVIMPTTAPLVKQSAVKAYGARITFCAPTLAAREETMTKRKEELEKEERKVEVIPPYDDLRVVAGQGTLVLEMVGQVADIAREKGLGTGKSKLDLDVVVAPVGGGGLLSGTAVAAKGLNPGILVVGAEPKNADDAKRSFDTGVWQPALDPVTVADGLKTSTGHITFPLIQQYADTICTVHETEIMYAPFHFKFKINVHVLSIMAQTSDEVGVRADEARHRAERSRASCRHSVFSGVQTAHRTLSRTQAQGVFRVRRCNNTIEHRLGFQWGKC